MGKNDYTTKEMLNMLHDEIKEIKADVKAMNCNMSEIGSHSSQLKAIWVAVIALLSSIIALATKIPR